MEAVLAQMDFLEVAVIGEFTDQATGQQAARCRLRAAATSFRNRSGTRSTAYVLQPERLVARPPSAP
jgi:hypothetical protein